MMRGSYLLKSQIMSRSSGGSRIKGSKVVGPEESADRVTFGIMELVVAFSMNIPGTVRLSSPELEKL
jgi:hypothetical protein